MKPYIMLLIAGIIFSGCTLKNPTPLATVDAVNLDRYGGKWYEIARYENHFEQGCIGATADYTLTPEHIGVLNQCYDAQGTLIKQAYGKAYAIENSSNSKLKVTFFWPFYGDYWVLMLADDYRYSVIGDPHRKYLWILAREKQLSSLDKESILSKLPTLGYDPHKLYWTNVEKIKVTP